MVPPIRVTLRDRSTHSSPSPARLHHRRALARSVPLRLTGAGHPLLAAAGPGGWGYVGVEVRITERGVGLPRLREPKTSQPLVSDSEVEAGAEDGTRTHDLLLGKETLYQLSYFRPFAAFAEPPAGRRRGQSTRLVPRMRLELIRPFGHRPLKTACLPIPPPGRQAGRSGGTRTHDLRFWRPLLCQLSYTPVPAKSTNRL